MCLRPITLYDLGINPSTGKHKLSAKRPDNNPLYSWPEILVPCGKCVSCLQARARNWIRRLQFELFVNPFATFITLTYDDAHLPDSPSKKHIQSFLKRLRNVSRDYGIKPQSDIRYFIVSERGDKFGRIHYHGIIYGLDMMSDPKWCTYLHHFHDFHPVYTSSVLEKIWGNGIVSVDFANDQNISYIANYMFSSGQSDNIRLFSQGLGSRFFVDYDSSSRPRPISLKRSAVQVANNGFIYIGDVSNPYRVGYPKFLDRYIGSFDEGLLNRLKISRREFSINNACHDRPSVVEHYLYNQQRVNKLKRKLDNES